MLIFGHRGAPGYPRRAENTCASFRKALRSGASGLEFDVRRCGDGRLVVLHDETIDRTTNGRGRVRSLNYANLRKYDAGFGSPVPLLADVLDEFGARCLLNIELKENGIAEDVKTRPGTPARKARHPLLFRMARTRARCSGNPDRPVELQARESHIGRG